MSSRQYDSSADPLPSFLRNLPHHRSPHIVKALDAIFHFIKWVWLTFIVGGLIVTVGFNIAQYGDPHLDHPERWKLWLWAQAHPALSIALAAILPFVTVLGLIAHFTPYAHPSKPPLPPPLPGEPLPLVRTLDRANFNMGDRVAATYTYVRRPVEAVYLQALATLRAASDGKHPKQGILTLGEANAGKTRLALEAMIVALPEWDALIWNLADGENKIPTAARLHGRNVAVFLDDVQAYAAGGAITSDTDGRSAQTLLGGPAATLRALFQRVCQDADHVVFVATCRREEREAADGSLGWLFEKLEAVMVPTFNKDEHSPEARTIITEFANNGKIRDEWNGTLGSLVLGLGRLHAEYVDLKNHRRSAVPVLRAMKLLTLGGIPALTGKRIRAVCDQILYEPTLATVGKAWDDALAELARLEFVTITPTDAGDLRLEIRKTDYFVYVVDDYPAERQRQQHRAQLVDALASLDDDDGLFFLGNGFYFDDQYSSAIVAYDEAIRLNPTYATAYYNMSVALALSGKLDEALVTCNKAIAIDGTLVVAWKLKAAILEELGREDEARAAEERAQQLEEQP